MYLTNQIRISVKDAYLVAYNLKLFNQKYVFHHHQIANTDC